MLGAQILLGFQLRGAFAEGFERLPQHTQSLDAVGTGLMVVVVGLLITPGPYHRIVEGGSDSDALHDVVTAIAALALFPFALALGIDVFIADERIFGSAAGAAAGSIAASVALALWYGLPRAQIKTRL